MAKNKDIFKILFLKFYKTKVIHFLMKKLIFILFLEKNII